MPRDVPEWIGKTDSEPVPMRVRLRVLINHGRICAGTCGGRLIRPGEEWICDHVVALINGGPNREGNLQPLCKWCNLNKTATDITQKSKTYAMARKHAGVRSAKGRGFPCGRNSAFKKKINGEVVRR